MQNNENVDEWINWIEEAIRLALKSFYCLNKITLKEIVHELKLQRDVDFHDNIIRFYGITKHESDNIFNPTKDYLLVMEYAASGTLRDYLKNNFHRLTWNNKYSLAYQLACSILCLHDEGIVHRDLHSCNVLVHQNSIKLADFGLSKRVDETSNSQSRELGKVPYTDPKVITDNLKLNEKSDVYSIGVLLWEISSGKPPFHEENYDLSLLYKISQGRREEIISDTPNDYSDLYTECWNGEQSKRPSIHEVVNRLRISLNSSSTTIYQQNMFNQIIPSTSNESLIPTSIKNPLHGESSQMIQNLSIIVIIVDEIVDLIFREVNRKDESKQHVLDYLNNHNINSKEIYNRLSFNQTNSNSIFLLGYFNYYGIGTPNDNRRAFNLFFNASIQDHILAQYYVGNCYEFGYGMITKNEKLAFVYYEKMAELDYAMGQHKLGYFYHIGKCIEKNFKKAPNWYKKAANNGHLIAMNNLGLLYIGEGIDVDNQKAFELFKKSAESEHSNGITMLGYCYNNGIGISINNKKAVELYQKAANLGNKTGQYNLAVMYEKGDGIEKDIDKAIYWYEQSAKQEHQDAQNKLKILKKN
ncbi:kinase-like domain-containing protein [Rhizophagus irregularis DAOM 181602=DAOM 197198]|uniref:Kinase-like domain-containing protein n=1 Tax=Rhizophagus irregularis (strain DAOM 181602 / DAOM 197198 / MUCL 43194) TaxID=747089 RepID=A0A2P4PLW7_RHIID|nr:kinase-like domain-containing protein [Rhizophagus irregularis DAOM 181602=DAOM 197198]POG66384.1 kinase-like domain-containing protein [Rhizophagus irregularis DAOM 181602=DAOM 197198]|eukprot:XP_025173250.1 kinase-like domain-containing protein [Rhizophagus irregularis DAOM 181602=DAOM 197198]